MPLRRYLHIILIILAFLGIGVLMNSQPEKFIPNRPPIYIVLLSHTLCIGVDLLILKQWRKIKYVAPRYFALALINFSICYLSNLLFGFDLSLAFIVRISIAISIVFTLAEQSELARFRKTENDRLAQEKLAAEQALLRQQLNPHFLFNSLNTLKGFIEEDQESAVDYLHQFAEVYRYVLASRDKDLIPLEEELELLEAYYKLLKARFGEKLKLEIALKEENLALAVPPLATQLLLENAIKHNELSRSKPLVFSLSSNAERLIARNPLQPKSSFDESNGLGLSNLATRLHYVSGKELTYGLSEDGQNFEVQLPLIKLHG
jgi:sensor histidine kinase YesM